ncbi:MAG TPA: alpha/beta hydrolase [Gemmatimonadaceae bacterium]|nr:alpha/beta hydrolase [Gemmatimonadaceae bacterium]
MSTATTWETKFLVVDGVSVATRIVGSGPRLVLLHRFRGTLDDWDPAFFSTLADNHEVMMFDSVGVGETGGVTPTSVEEMADFAARVIQAEGTEPVDIFGWSLGGFVAQVLAIKYPQLVRKLVLTGTMPSGGTPELTWSDDWLKRASVPVPSAENVLALMYTDSETSRGAGMASLGRVPHPPAAYVSPVSMAAQAEAIRRFADGEDGNWYTRLGDIVAPTLVANGDRDELFAAIDSVILAAQIPGSQLAIYPDSGHAFLFQYAERFAEDVGRFLENKGGF